MTSQVWHALQGAAAADLQVGAMGANANARSHRHDSILYSMTHMSDTGALGRCSARWEGTPQECEMIICSAVTANWHLTVTAR